jgi:hypothetical protein
MKPALLLFLLIFAGCAGARYQLAKPGEIPASLPNLDIQTSSYFAELKREYGKGLVYERAKIKYLLGHTSESAYQFVRMDVVYGGERTAKHLRKKYQQRFSEIKTAQEFIDKVASISKDWGRPYLALPGDGRAYRTGDILNYELKRLDAYMDKLHRSGS